MRRPSRDDLDLASEWLRAYEGGPECERVADWLDSLIVKSVVDQAIRKVQRQVEQDTGNKPTTAQVRAALKQAQQAKAERNQP